MDFGKIGMEEGWLDSFVPKCGPPTPGYEARAHDDVIFNKE